MKNWFENKRKELEGDPGFAFEAGILAFEEELAKHQVDTPPECAEIIEKYFWELYEE